MAEFLKKNPHISIYTLCAYILIFAIGLLAGKELTQPQIIRNTVLRESGYKYINPILLCNINNNQKYNEDIVLSDKLNDYVKEHPENEISAYYLSLTSGGWAAVNQDKTYSPASMLKVPTMVETLRNEEANPGTLSKEVYYGGNFDDNQMEDIKPEKFITPGKSYTIDQLLTYMIVYSDNNALRLIHNSMPANSFKELYKDLNIVIPDNTLDFMSAKTYSLILRVLYNSTYLNRESSEKALKLMINKNSFPNGLKAGVPDDVEIAEKFGERMILNTKLEVQKRELHDCGIVYAKDKPYILCVMTKGQEFTSLANAIQDISKIVYERVNK